MLVIAMPKSMSSSIKSYFGKKPGIKVRTDFVEEDKLLPFAEGWKYFLSLTNACREFPLEMALSICESRSMFRKHHIPPTKNNLEVFSKGKKVILLRDVNEVIASWRRTTLLKGSPLKGFSPFKDPIFLEKNEDEWIHQAEMSGLLDELRRFKEGWEKHTQNALHITYNQLLHDPQNTVNSVEEFFGLPLTKKVVLPKKRYTRGERTNV